MRIETSRLWLRPYAQTDISAALAVLGDPETMSFYPQPYSEEQVTAILRKNIDSYNLHGYGLLAMIEKSSERLVGDCGITIQNIDGKDEYEVGYRVGKAWWGKGYAHEAATAAVKHGFATLGLGRLCSHMPADHTQSRRVAEKLGMVLEKQYLNPRNRGYLTCVYAIQRETSASR
jgi:[ribosomal protein S5]-alanine N-acetyltransferase